VKRREERRGEERRTTVEKNIRDDGVQRVGIYIFKPLGNIIFLRSTNGFGRVTHSEFEC
jgi:hypothetical protein